VLQCVALRRSVLQCVAVCCSVLQCVAVCCSVLQCAAKSAACMDADSRGLLLQYVVIQEILICWRWCRQGARTDCGDCRPACNMTQQRGKVPPRGLSLVERRQRVFGRGRVQERRGQGEQWEYFRTCNDNKTYRSLLYGLS